MMDSEIKVLVVDDEELIRNVLGRMLNNNGYKYQLAANAAEAREWLKKERFELVLTDINMPGESGIDLIQYIISDFPETAVIMVTVFTDPQVAKRALESGAYGYIIKPFDSNQVMIQIANALHRRGLEIENRIHRKDLELLVQNRTAELYHTIQLLEQTEKSLRESEEKFRSISAFANDAIAMIDENGLISYWNKAAEKIFGFSSEEVTGKEIHQIITPARYYEYYKKAFNQFVETGTGTIIGKTIEFKAIRKDGSEFPIDISVSAVKIKNVWHAIAIIRDITERKFAEEELRAANAEINQLVLSISSILVGINEKDRIFQWNPTAEKTLGLVAKDAIGKSIQELNTPWDVERVLEGIKQCKKKDHPIRLNDLRFKRMNGKDGFLNISISPIQNYIGSYSGLILLGEDLTDHKLLQNQLAQAQKLESVGQLAAGIAHEINTPTQYIGDNVRFLQNAFRDFNGLISKYQSLQANQLEQQKIIEHLQEVNAFAQQIDVNYLLKEIPNAIQETLEGVERVTKIVRAMKDFSHPGTENKKEIDINKAIESTITVARNEWKYVADIETDFDPHFPLVPCLPGEFNQVILNLLINAAHAIADVVGSNPQQKGKIKISTHGNGKWAEIRISDTGPGIPESIRAKVFDPFFTTKEVGKGTGQGLSIARSIIVDKHHGEIKFDTEVGKGTTFIINLPLSNHQDEAGKDCEEENTFCG